MLKIDLKDIEKAPGDWSEIFEYREDLAKLRGALDEIGRDFKNVLVVGNGGSITSFDAICHAVEPEKQWKSVWTMDPDFIGNVKKEYKKEDTVIVAVSKSGNTLGQIEALLAFEGYSVVVVTETKSGALSEIATKMNWRVVEHPPVGGRFSAGTSSTLLSAALAGVDIEKIQKGISKGYETYKDLAYSLSKYYLEKEKSGLNEVYVTIYPSLLEKFQNLIIQLMHESVCKDGQGQTFYAAMAPESQHHTNQRFLGGRKNVVGTFVVCKNAKKDITLKVPSNLADVEYKGEALGFIDNLSMNYALQAEYLGTKQDADKNDIPNVTITIDKVGEETVGEMISFWHMVAFYSSIIRNVNPFDQPAVENSKNITLGFIKSKS